MSLDVYLILKSPVRINKGKSYIDTEITIQAYEANITHNLNKMAEAAGIYKELWRPDEIGKTRAHEIIEALEKGLADLKARPDYYQQFNSPNGWGMYEHFVPFVEGYLNACKEFPEAYIEVSR